MQPHSSLSITHTLVRYRFSCVTITPSIKTTFILIQQNQKKWTSTLGESHNSPESQPREIRRSIICTIPALYDRYIYRCMSVCMYVCMFMGAHRYRNRATSLDGLHRSHKIKSLPLFFFIIYNLFILLENSPNFTTIIIFFDVDDNVTMCHSRLSIIIKHRIWGGWLGNDIMVTHKWRTGIASVIIFYYQVLVFANVKYQAVCLPMSVHLPVCLWKIFSRAMPEA